MNNFKNYNSTEEHTAALNNLVADANHLAETLEDAHQATSEPYDIFLYGLDDFFALKEDMTPELKTLANQAIYVYQDAKTKVVKAEAALFSATKDMEHCASLIFDMVEKASN